jgi:hypothetical protein
MQNLFKSVEDQSHVAELETLKLNIAFARRLVRDLEQVYDVHVENKRRNETTMEVVVYAPSQAGRYGWGFTFTATAESVTFEDGRGVWLESMSRVLNAKVGKNDYGDDAKANDAILAKAAKKIGVQVKRNRDSACGDHFTLKMELSETDKHLSAKLKAIVGTMQAQDVVSRL